MSRKSAEQRWADKFCKNIEETASKLFGKSCATCGQVIDGDKPGHPRHCKGCYAEDAKRTAAEEA